MMNTLNREAVRELSSVIQAAIKDVGKQHGVSLTMGNIRFNSDRATFKLEAAVVGDGSVNNETPARLDFVKHAKRYGMDPSWLDKTFRDYSREYTVVGLLPNRRKNNVLVSRNGKEYIMPAETVIRLMTNGDNAHPVNLFPDTATPELMDKINNLVSEAENHYKGISSGGCDFSTYEEQETRLYKQLKEISVSVGTGLKVGKHVKFQVADGYANYIVTKILGSTVLVKHLPLGDSYTFLGVYETDDGNLALPTMVAKRQVERSEFMEEMFVNK